MIFTTFTIVKRINFTTGEIEIDSTTGDAKE